MAADSPGPDGPSESASDGTDRWSIAYYLTVHPYRSAAIGAAAVLVLAYATLVAQELLLAIWLVLVGFLAHLALRFVRAFERIAGAAERLAEDGD